MKKFFAILLCVIMVLAIVACDTSSNKNDDDDKKPETTKEVEYKLGMGVVVDMNSSVKGTAQVDATVAAVVTDADGKIVACRIDVAQNKYALATDTPAKTFQTKMERGDDYGMAAAVNFGMDWNGDGVVKEWYDQAKAFENYVVGMTAAQVAAIETQVVEGHGYVIAADEDLLSAGCTIQITDFVEAVVAACEDEQAMTFKTAEKFTLGVAAKTSAADTTSTVVKMYSDFAATVVVDGKIVAALNDAIQPDITVDAEGNIVETAYSATKRERKEDYGMAPAVNFGMDWNGDGVVLEWYLQSEAFSKHVVGMTAAEVEAMATQVVEGHGYVISADEDLLAAGCTIQITAIKAVVAQAAKNAR